MSFANGEFELQNLYSHPVLYFLAEKYNIEEITLSVVFGELDEFGEVVLGSHYSQLETNAKEYTCSIRNNSWQELIFGSGSTPLLAALRCLMEAQYHFNKQSQSLIQALHFELSDCDE